ncbi:DUF342 domain-containing protein [Vibrio maerlii]|uniref:DUF342 domain-containing protein n=1 Tax=Vibrio maerlii TaxID=2231648 RepID=UPI000E3EC591|nr:FapA family protein [Vibrio maerlii]
MWQEILSLSDDKQQVIATLTPELDIVGALNTDDMFPVIEELGAAHYFFDEKAALNFINACKEQTKAAFDGFSVAYVKNAQLSIELVEEDMLAVMHVVGAYGGKGLSGAEIMQALSEAHVTKGINKLALKKVLMMSHKLGAGDNFSQPVAKGKPAVQGKDTQFQPLVEDITKQVLKPQTENQDTDKVDMRDLGETITVAANDPLIRRVPSTKGEPGYTVQGKIILPVAGKEIMLKPGKGTAVSSKNPNILIATEAGLPKIRPTGAEVDNALCLSKIDATTGHVKFKGCVVVSGDIEPGMIVKATGSITVGGFIESAEVQAQGDILVGKGIIGHSNHEEGEFSCKVLSGGKITANYAQFSMLQSHSDVQLSLHCMNNDIRCGGNLIVLDASEKHGTLSGGESTVGGFVTCLQLGVEGDTMTRVRAFSRYEQYKEKLAELKNKNGELQTDIMDIIRKEMEYKKTPKSERDVEAYETMMAGKAKLVTALDKLKLQLERVQAEFDYKLQNTLVTAKDKVFTRVNVFFGNEQVLTKKTHGPSVFGFDQYKITLTSMVETEGDV